ncbi:MAG TPA: hypothetical protein VMI54_06965 [Polyangiaceae bacterium]|nr:hypothetical protein [Polyangiaceae bacterium]
MALPMLPPIAVSALQWTAQQSAPWALRRATGWFAWWGQSKLDKRAEAEIRQVADALVPEHVVDVTAVCQPQTIHGIVGNEVVIGLRIVSTAPVAVRPLRLEKVSCSLVWDGRATRVDVDDRPIALTNGVDFLRVGGEHMVELKSRFEWNGPPPPQNAAVPLAISGKLVIAAPWRAEYKPAEFGSNVFVRVNGV